MKWSVFALSVGISCMLMLAGCGSSPEDKVYEAFKCGKVATLLEQNKNSDIAMKKAIPYIRQMEKGGGSPARLAMEMSQRFQDDVPLYKLSLDGQMGLLTEIYQSQTCQALYEPMEGLNDVDTKTGTQAHSRNGESTAHEDRASDDKVIESTIVSVAASESGEEYTAARKVAMGDLNGDGTSDAAVLFTIDVGSQNTSTLYLSAFLRQNDGSLKLADTAPVGGVGSAINGVAVKDGWVKLKTLTLGPNDPDCCPSVEGEVEYLLHNEKIRQVGN
ncbi:hypothetical protein [Frateuria soli]|uniref:hypothetical protein n=1 Tax=Frateuria soli TaxID=1542730 RepID=UPI001E564A2C|nr:hypothetical protein [Frateuria soli]UGB37248.1 hypothetical protein LQ771_10435 [Frateuria soli]